LGRQQKTLRGEEQSTMGGRRTTFGGGINVTKNTKKAFMQRGKEGGGWRMWEKTS